MSQFAPINLNSDICQLLSCISEKFIVDFANGIDVARDQVHQQKNRSNFFARLCDGMTGRQVQRQTQINASLADGVEASLTWLTELSESLARSNLAIGQVQERINRLKLDVAKIADYSIQTRRQLEQLAQRLDERHHLIEVRIAHIDIVQQVQLQLDHVFNKWRAGRYHSFSLSGRCYAVLEELRWGVFGDYCRMISAAQQQCFLEDLANRVIAQIAHDSKQSTVARLSVNEWLKIPNDHAVLADATTALAYMGDCFSEDNHPFAYSVTQFPTTLPLKFPRISSSERMVTGLITDVFRNQC